MVNTCSVFGCHSEKEQTKAAVFKFPKENTELRQRWLRFINRKNVNPNSSYLFICERHFEEKYLNKQNNQRVRLCNAKNPVPTIHPPSIVNTTPSVLPTLSTPRKPPKARVYRDDEINSEAFKSMAIATFSEVNESLLKSLGNGFLFSKNEDCAIFYRFDTNSIPAPKVCEMIKIDSNLHVKLFYESSSIPLPSWFRKGGNCVLKSVMELENFPAYIRLMAEENGSAIEDEIHQLRFKKKPIYSSSLLRYALTLRYTSMQSYKLLQEEFNMPSVSLLKKLTHGSLDTVKAAKLLQKSGSISQDVILMFDEMYLQKSQEYVGGELCGANENGMLYKSVLCFMIVGLQNNVPFIIKTVPVNKLESDSLKEEILTTIELLHSCSYKVMLDILLVFLTIIIHNS